MKAVRIKFHQDTAQFRNPLMNGKNRTTFPLPPYSTMIGMVHRLCKWDTTHTINVSVMCTNERLSSPQVDRSYGWIGGNPARTLTKEFQTRWSIVVDDGSDGYMGWGRMLKNDSILVDRNYTVHINSENENELKQIYQAFLYPPIYPSLGRWEDTIRIDEVKIVNVEDEEKEEITIHIIGEVKYPGIVILKSGQRIVDAIEAAGGETEEADLNKLNLAQILNDGDKIYVPNKTDEIEDYKDTTGESSTVNLNTATLEELTSLPGIGESTAQKIIDYRRQNGKFKAIEDLKNVSGIGESKFDNIKDKITVR